MSTRISSVAEENQTAGAVNSKIRSQVLLLLTWRCRSIRASHGQYRAAGILSTYGIILTCINIVTAIAVLFLTNNRFFAIASSTGTGENTDWSWFSSDGLTALAGLFVVLTTALQYILRLDEKSKDAKRAGNDFTEVKRRIEVMLVNGTEITATAINEIQTLHTHTSRYHSLVPKGIWRQAHKLGNKNILSELEFENEIRSRYSLPLMSVTEMEAAGDTNDNSNNRVDS